MIFRRAQMKTKRKIVYLFLALAMILSLGACVTGSGTTAKPTPEATQGDRIENATVEVVRSAAPLKTAYDNVVLKSFVAPEPFKTDYPDVADTCKFAVISHLRTLKAFAKVVEDAGQKFSGKTLLVDGQIEDMRIASTAARIWGGAFAGSSFMNIRIRLTDAATGKVVQEKVIASSANAFAAAWNFGASDKSMPSDMGKIIGEYLATIASGKK